jgi:hypothetical protein
MHLFIKFWKPKDAWYELANKERVSFIKEAQRQMLEVSSRGLETVGWAEIEPATPEHDSGYRYVSVYKAPDKTTMDKFHTSMINFHWYYYFEQVNAVGKLESPGAILGRVVEL